MARPAVLALLAVAACGPLLGVEAITIDEPAVDASGPEPAAQAEAGTAEDAPPIEAPCAVGATRACNAHPEDGKGPCKAGSQTCGAAGWSACEGDIGPTAETCDAVDRNCNGTPGIDEAAPPAPPGTMDCTHIFACNAPGRGPLFYRTGIGFTNAAGANTLWTAFAPRGDFSDMTFPPGTVRISRDGTGTKLGPVTKPSVCCPEGCPTANTLFDGQGQFYTVP